jgi:hypothetical protein
VVAGAALSVALIPLTLLAVPSRAEAATTPTVTITWDGSKFTSNPSVATGTIVKWKNAGTSPTAGKLKITYKSGPTQFSPITIAPGATSSGTKMTGGSVSAKEVAHGSQPVLVQTNVGDCTITIVPRPATPPPTRPPTQPPTSNPTSHTSHTTKPAAKAAPPPAPPTGVTNPPPLGAGAGAVPQPAPSPAGPGPVVAGPQPTPTPAAESPAVTTDVPARALGQSVPARKYGLPGALAVVLLAGVAVGVVRLARVEYANGNGQHSMGGGIGSADESAPEPPN